MASPSHIVASAALLQSTRLCLYDRCTLKHPHTVVIDGESLTLEKLIALGKVDSKLRISERAMERVMKSRKVIDGFLQSDRVVYGINTGFGRLSNVQIKDAELEQLQQNLIMSHATGVGKPLPIEIARRCMVLRINTVLKGCSGISPTTLERLIQFFNSGLVPYIRDQGSVGASGDLVPMAHIALNLMGQGRVYDPKVGEYVENSAELMKSYGLTVVELRAKDGLALINGTQFICGVGSKAIENALHIVRLAHLAAACTLTVLRGHPDAYDDQIATVRPHPGQVLSAEIMRKLVPKGTQDPDTEDVQDAYSLRCVPQVHGAVLEEIEKCLRVFETEINSATDNPLVFGETESMLSGGNFHGEYVAKAFDTLGIYCHELANISYSRLMRLLNPDKNKNTLPAFLATDSGLCNGFMTWENVSAALVSENKVLCHPSSVDSMSTCADKEDHVSMGGMSARKAVLISDNVAHALTIEIMAGVQALQILREKDAGFRIPPAVKATMDVVIPLFPKLETDRYTVPDHDRVYDDLKDGKLFEKVVGPRYGEVDALSRL